VATVWAGHQFPYLQKSVKGERRREKAQGYGVGGRGRERQISEQIYNQTERKVVRTLFILP
jgi:hypothetical protein